MNMTSGANTSIQPVDTEPDTVVLKQGSSMRFLKGKIATVDCSASPGAAITLVAGGKTSKLHVKDTGHVIVIGANSFSCAWKNQSAAVNFRENGDADGDVVSIEVQ
jgi:hypothetical protein